jgi:hypothetical protein
MVWKSKRVKALEQEIANYQRDRIQLLKVLKTMDQALEREQDLVKRLSKSLVKRKN